MTNLESVDLEILENLSSSLPFLSLVLFNGWPFSKSLFRKIQNLASFQTEFGLSGNPGNSLTHIEVSGRPG